MSRPPLPPLPFKVKTIFSWAGEQEGDLGFLENEIIEVLAIVDEAWWNGKLRRNNAEGIFPQEFVEILEDKLSQSSSNLSLNNSRFNTPTKQQNRSNNTTPQTSMFKSNMKKSNTLNPNVSYDDGDASFDTSFDADKMFKSYGYSPSNRGKPSRNRMSYYPEADSRFQHPSKSINDLKRLSLQERDNKMSRSQQYLPQTNAPVPIKYHSYMDVNISRFEEPKHRIKKTEQDLLYEFEEIAKKKAMLEMELQRLKQMEQQPSKKTNSSLNSYSDERHSDLSKNMSRYVTDEEDDEYTYGHHFSPPTPPTPPTREESPPPPPPPKHKDVEPVFSRSNLRTSQTMGAFHSSQGEATEIDLLRLSQQQEELKASIKSLQSDVLNLSELSATSAGSFMRHKYEKEMYESSMKNQEVPEKEEEKSSIPGKETIDSVFQDKKSKQSKIFSKLLRKSHTEPNLNPLERNLKHQEEMDWASLKMHVNRMNSLTSQEKQTRTKRVVREEGNLIVKPLDYVSEINANETVGETNEGFDISDIRYSKVASFMEHYNTTSDMNDMISDISVKFHASKLNQIRCVLLHMCKFRIIEELNKISTLKPKLKDVQYKGEASIYQINYLCKKILDALRIPSEIVPGFWKKPNEFYHNEQFVINHCWLSVLVNDSFRIMDIFNFKQGSVCNLKKFNEFYFLAEPLSVVSTHIPSIIDLQHVMPPIDPNIAFYLPRTYSGFYKNHLSFKNFNNALTRLKDLEFFELELDIPMDVELFTLVKTSKITTNELSLCQIKWVNQKRIAKIKAMLPDKESIGVLQIFAGEKGLQKHFDNIHELAIVIPLYHQGSSKSTSFVQRFPTVQSQNHDLYITKPQVNKLLLKQQYSFEIEQYPSQGITPTTTTRDFKLVIESPSGRYFPLSKDDESKPFGVYSSNIKCSETGVYRGLVIGDSGASWYVFAQWECINTI